MSLTNMVIMPGEDYQQTCDAVREKTGGTEPIKSGQLPAAVGDVFLAGEQANENKWAKKFYMTTIRGNGQRDISVELPFEPDYVRLGFFNPISMYSPNSMCYVERDFKTFAYRAGYVARIEAGTNMYTVNMSNNGISNYIGYKDGSFFFINLPVIPEGPVWRPEADYLLVAFKYTEEGKTDEELLKDYVMSLPDSGGTVTLSQRRFTDTGMTEAAFNAFTAEQKPNWTFVIA